MTADVYKNASLEHIYSARQLYHAGNFALAIYVSGLALECILRAYRVRRNPEFDSRHDLYELKRLAAFGDMIPERQARRVNAAISEIATIWRNEHRYHSNDSIRTELKSRGLSRGIKGDFLKERTRRAVEAAFQVVTVGGAQWKA